MVWTLIKWVAAMVIAMLVFSYIVDTDTRYKVNEFISKVKSSARQIDLSEDSSVKSGKDLCINKVKEDFKIQKIKSPKDFSYSILEVKEFDSMGEAEDYRKKYTTFNLLDPLCEGQRVSKAIAVLFEIRYEDVAEPFTGIKIDKETGAVLCNEKGEYLLRGYSWECKEKLQQQETEELVKEELITEELEGEGLLKEGEDNYIVDSTQIVSKSITTEDSCKIQCTAVCDKKGYAYHSSTYEGESVCKCNCAAK